MADQWASGSSYEMYVGRWSRLVATEFVGWLEQPQGLRWLDVGCGTGALSATVLRLARPAAVTGIDASRGYVEHARHGVPGATFEVGDAQALTVAAGSVDVVVSGLMLNFLPEPRLAVESMASAVRQGGVVGAYVWDYAQRMEMIRAFWDAAVTLDPSAEPLDEAVRFPLCDPQALAQLLTEGGLVDVRTAAIEVPTVFRDFDDYWEPFLSGEGPAPGYCLGLPVARRLALRDALRESLPIAADGSIALVARAWAVRGTAPGAG